MPGPGNAEFLKKTSLTKDTIELQFKVLTDFDYLPGQFLNIKIDDGQEFPCFRAYSISGYDEKNKILDLCVRIIENGRGSNYLKNLKTEDKILFIGPSGKFILDENTIHTFIATGSGIAPIKAMIESIKDKKEHTTNLFFGLRFEEDIYFKEYFENIAKNNKNFHFFLTLSKANDDWKGLKGRVTDLLSDTSKIPEFEKSSFYICGNPEMVIDVEQNLLKKGIVVEKIHTEKY